MPRAYIRRQPKSACRSSADYVNFSTDLGGMICTACHEPIRNGDLAFVVSHGAESEKYPLKDYIRWTGIAYHAKPRHGRDTACLDPRTLPGMAGRDEVDSEWSYVSAEVSGPQAKMGALFSPQNKATHLKTD